MKSSRIVPAVITLALAFFFTCAVSSVTAGSMGNGGVQRKKLVVDSIDAAAGTVAFKSTIDQSVHTYKIDATTNIGIVNAKGTIDQIKVGMKVANYVMAAGQVPPTGGQMEPDGETLKSLLVSPAPALPATP